MENYFIRLTGKVNIPKKVSIGHNFKLELQGSVTDERRSDLENGDFEVTSTFRPITCEIKTDLGETIKGKDTRSRSQQIRSYLYRIWESNNDPRGHEEAYDQTMKYILGNIEEIYNRAKK